MENNDLEDWNTSWLYYIGKISEYRLCQILDEHVKMPSIYYYLLDANYFYKSIFEEFCK